MAKRDHLCGIGFTVVSGHGPDGLTNAEVLSALRLRLSELEDTFAGEPDAQSMAAEGVFEVVETVEC